MEGQSILREQQYNTVAPIEMVAVNDSFGESGTPAQLMDKYGLNATAIVEAALRLRNR